MDHIQDGVRVDTRPIEAQMQDYLHEDLYGGLPVVWTEKPQTSWFMPSQRNQDGSFSCVAQSSASAMESMISLISSAGIYKLRAGGLGSQGMFLQDIGNILYNTGTIVEAVTPSQNLTETQMNAINLPVTMTMKATGYRTIGLISIDAVAEAVQAYGNCLLIFDSNTQEYQQTPIYLGTPTTFGHCICAVDFTLINGIKTLCCRDSAGQFSSPTGVRLITEDFLSKRCGGAMYLLGATPITPPAPPVVPAMVPFLIDMSLGQSSTEIARLQAFLAKLKYFSYPENTGYYGELTRLAVLAFQRKYVSTQSWWSNIVVEFYQGKNCYAMTRKIINQMLGYA
jgi:hypothetical protein